MPDPRFTILTTDPAVVHTILCRVCDSTFIVTSHISNAVSDLPLAELHTCGSDDA